MKKEHTNILNIVSALLALAGIIVMFTSVKFGNALADQWLMNSAFGMADTSEYEMVAKTYINNFVIIGSLLLGAGILTGLFTLITFILYGKNEIKVEESNENQNI